MWIRALGCAALLLAAGMGKMRAADDARWEAGAAVGFGAYRNGSVYAPAGKVVAGIQNRFAAGVVVTENRYQHLSGEFRYLFQDGDPFLKAGAVKTNMQGQSHAFHYDLLLHLHQRGRRVRPFVAAGMGAKYFEVTGPLNAAAPFANIAAFTGCNDWRVLFAAGAGVEVRLQRHVALRADFRDYITPFPKTMIERAAGATARGIFHQFTPMVGFSYVF